jgi:hypothetical protein
MGLGDSPLCRKCGAEETSADVLCECEALATLTHTYLGSFFLDPEDVRELSLRGRSGTENRALITWTLVKWHKGPVKGLRASGP